MFDSSAKIQPGILIGNLVEFGSFKQCIQIEFNDITGKHCLIKITPNLGLIKKILSFRNVTEKRFGKIRLIVEKSALFWSVCVPESCPISEILKHFKRVVLDLSEGLSLNITLDKNHCVTSKTTQEIGLAQYLAL